MTIQQVSSKPLSKLMNRDHLFVNKRKREKVSPLKA